MTSTKTTNNSHALTDRLRYVEASPTLALAAKAKALAKAGKSVIDFTAGEPDLPTPEPVKQAGIAAISQDRTRYTPVAGIPELRSAIAGDLNKQRQTHYSASQVLVSCGAKQALFNSFQALCQAGDEVIVLSPYWVSYPPLVRLAGATPVIVETSKRDQFLADVARIQAACSPATKAIVLNSPNNPTGAVFDEERLVAIAQLAHERNLIVISDEIYDRLVYPPARHHSIVQCSPALVDQTLIVSGVSKTYRMTGWRIGYVAGPQTWIEAMEAIQSHSTSNPSSISQYAALAALQGDQASIAQMVEMYQQRRDRLVKGLNALAGCWAQVPDGAFYVWCDVSGLKQPAAAIAAQWLEDALVATIPGEGFGAPHYIRFSFPVSLETIDEGLRRLSQWVAHH